MNVKIEYQIDAIPKFFSPDEVALFGGVAVYIHTQKSRKTSDIDLLVLKPSEDLFRRIGNYKKELKTNVDISPRALAFSCLDLSTPESLTYIIEKHRAQTKKEISILTREGLIASKLTSLQISGEEYQPTQEGIKVLRDKDLEDIINLLNLNPNLQNISEILKHNPYLKNESIDLERFVNESLEIIQNPNYNLNIRRNAYGISKVLGQVNSDDREKVRTKLLEKEEELNDTAKFAFWLSNEAQTDIYTS